MDTSFMCAEDIKGWLWGIEQEEDSKMAESNRGARGNWCLFIKLVQAVWDMGEIPWQLC